MKIEIFIIIIFALFGCDSDSDENHHANSDQGVNNMESEFQLEGVWGLTNYFDTIIAHKEIANYRMQRPTWFGIILDIRDDRVFNYGSIYNDSGFYILNSDTIRIFEMYEENWCLLKSSPNLILRQLPNASKIDTAEYVYRKREDLVYMTKNFNPKFPSVKIEPYVSQYFEKELLQGTYVFKNSEKIVKFGSQNELEGFDNYTSYKVDDYFGTYHPFNNYDVLYLEVDTTEYYDCWNWKFIENELILTKFKQDWRDRDNFILTDEQIILVKN